MCVLAWQVSDCIEIRVQLLVTCVRVPVTSPPHADESRCTPDYSRDNIREQITSFPAALITHFCKKPRLGAHNRGVYALRLIRSKLCSPFARLITLLLSGEHRSSSRSSRVEGHRGDANAGMNAKPNSRCHKLDEQITRSWIRSSSESCTDFRSCQILNF